MRPVPSLQPDASPRRDTVPVVALLVLAPVVGEVLFGTTRITTFFVLLPQIGTWGCASLLIRDVVRRRRLGWPAILLLGMALAVAEECLIQQTSLAPLVGVDPARIYGRAFGVNWVYLLWALGYESVWVVVLPVQLTELLFPERRDEPWLGKRGLVISAFVFGLASFVAWYSWTQVFVPRFFPGAVYRVPWYSLVVALAAIVAFVAAALGPRHSPPARETADLPPQPWFLAIISFVMGLPWFALVFLAYGAMPALPAAIPMAAGLALAGIAYFLITRWSANPAWQDSSRLALIFGGLIASMLPGFLVLKLSGAPAVDVIGKLVMNFVAVCFLARLARRISMRATTP